MSEYQYFEFRAMDRALSREEQAELRAYSSRARITATSFINEYSWGDFKGDADGWVERYFDAFLYLANWGSRQLKFRLPRHLLTEDVLAEYGDIDSLTVRDTGSCAVLTFSSEEVEARERVDGEGHLAGLLPVRFELLRGDLRSLYLAWLRSAQEGFVEEGVLEPPVPRGLGNLTGAQRDFANFLDIDEDLIVTAAKASPLLEMPPSSLLLIEKWLEHMPAAEKDDYLARIICGDEPNLTSELIRRATVSQNETAIGNRRTVLDLLTETEKTRDIRERLEAEHTAREKARLEMETAQARSKYLDGLAGKESTLWEKVEDLAATKIAARYGDAIKLLVDLRDLAERGDKVDFEERLITFRRDYSNRPGLIDRIDRAGL